VTVSPCNSKRSSRARLQQNKWHNNDAEILKIWPRCIIASGALKQNGHIQGGHARKYAQAAVMRGGWSAQHGALSRIGYDRNFAGTVTQPSKASLLDLAYEIW
jgi:hypothetical protein